MRVLRTPSALVGCIGTLLVVVIGLFAPYFYPDDPLNFVTMPFTPPFQDAAYPLGADIVGRDIAAGIAHGARVSLLIGLVSSLLATFIGTTVGLFSGYYRGAAESVLMWVTAIFQTMPPFLFAVVVVSIVGPSVTTIAIAIGITSWPVIARLVRAEVLALRRREFVLGAISIGMGDIHILFSQLLPNVVSSITVAFSLMVANAILTESGMAFLGLGDPNVASWGTMIATGREAMRDDLYMIAIPGLAIIVTVLSLNLLGDGLNDAMNPRLQR